MSDSIHAVILDFGGVLGLPQDPERVAAMATLCGISERSLLELYGQDRLELDRGTLSSDEYWGRILARGGGVAPTAELVKRIEYEDTLGWARINHDMVKWAGELRAAGFKTAILSNMPPDKLVFMRTSPDFLWMAGFDVTVFSCDFKLVKPEPAIYKVCLKRLGMAPDKCLFLDDSSVNIEAARTLGIHALHFQSAASSAGQLRTRWGLPVASIERAR